MSIDKTIRRVTDPSAQELENYRYWQSQPVGDRLTAVWDASESAYAFAVHFFESREKGIGNIDQGQLTE